MHLIFAVVVHCRFKNTIRNECKYRNLKSSIALCSIYDKEQRFEGQGLVNVEESRDESVKEEEEGCVCLFGRFKYRQMLPFAALKRSNLQSLEAFAPAFLGYLLELYLHEKHSLHSHFRKQIHFDPVTEFACRLLTMAGLP